MDSHMRADLGHQMLGQHATTLWGNFSTAQALSNLLSFKLCLMGILLAGLGDQFLYQQCGKAQ